MGVEEQRDGVRVRQCEGAPNRATQHFRQHHLRLARGVDRESVEGSVQIFEQRSGLGFVNRHLC